MLQEAIISGLTVQQLVRRVGSGFRKGESRNLQVGEELKAKSRASILAALLVTPTTSIFHKVINYVTLDWFALQYG